METIRKTLNGSYITRLNELGRMVTTRVSRQRLNELIKEIRYDMGTRKHAKLEVIHEKNKVICVRVDYDTHIRVNNNPHIMRKCGIDCIQNNFMKFYPKKELK